MKKLFIIIVGISVITSCSQNLDLIPSSSSIRITSKGFDYLGQVHNELVLESYANVDFAHSKDCATEIEIQFLKTKIVDDLKQDREELINNTKLRFEKLKSIDFDFRNSKDYPFSYSSYFYLKAIMENLDGVNNVDEFYNATKILKNKVLSDKRLNVYEKEMIIGTLSIADNSFYLWSPKIMGGLDLYSITKRDEITLRGKTTSRRWSWRNVAKADVASSAVYFQSLGVGAAIGIITPGSNVAILGGWALSSGLSSALGGVL